MWDIKLVCIYVDSKKSWWIVLMCFKATIWINSVEHPNIYKKNNNNNDSAVKLDCVPNMGFDLQFIALLDR